MQKKIPRLAVSFFAYCVNVGAVLFGNDLEGDFYADFFVKFNDSFVVTKFFDGFLDNDDFAVDVVAEFFESFSDLDIVDRAEDCAVGAGFSTDSESHVFEGFGGSFSVGFDFSKFVSALALVFSEHFKRRFRSDNGFALRNKVVTTVAALYLYYVVLVTKVCDIFFKNKFHNVTALKWIISSSRLRKGGVRGGGRV